MTPFDIDDRQYRARPFDADVHISLLLRLAPVFTSLLVAGPDMLGAKQRQSAVEVKDGLVFLSDLLKPNTGTAEALAALDRNGDAKLIIAECMKAADQIVDGKPYPVMTKAGVVSNQIANGDWMTKLRITIAVVRINFGAHLKNIGVDIDGFLGTTPDGAPGDAV